MDEQLQNSLSKLGVKVSNLDYYKQAFTHRSYLNESKQVFRSNERMEFLGDSVLSFIISSHLFKLRQDDNEGDLTNLRAYMVKTDSLAKAAVVLSLGKYLKLSRGEELSGGRNNPQLLANTYESLLGAIFLDLGIDSATLFVHNTLLPLFENEVLRGAPKDPKSTLQELAQYKFHFSPKYKILQAVGPDHAKHFKVGVYLKGDIAGIGEGSSKQQAEESAARQAILKLQSANDHSNS